jgi:hypothetical protein
MMTTREGGRRSTWEQAFHQISMCPTSFNVVAAAETPASDAAMERDTALIGTLTGTGVTASIVLAISASSYRQGYNSRCGSRRRPDVRLFIGSASITMGGGDLE